MPKEYYSYLMLICRRNRQFVVAVITCPRCSELDYKFTTGRSAGNCCSTSFECVQYENEQEFERIPG